MSDRGSNSGSQSLTSSQKETIEYEDMTPGDSASQVKLSVLRASEVARRAAAEVRARTARRRAAKELRIAAMRDEIVEIETEGAKEALEVEDEIFQRELRKTGSPGRGSVSEPRGVTSWAPDGQMRRIRVEETKTSCMVMCGTTGSNAARSSSYQSIIPRKLFREEEGESQATIAEGSRAAPPEEPLELPCATEDTEEGRRNRVEAWISETTIQEADWKDSERSGTIYRDQDVRVRVPKRMSSRVHSTSQRRSDANSATRRIEQDPGQGTREKSNLASSRRSVMSVDLRPRKRPSEASEVIEGSQNSRGRSGEGAGVRSSRTSRITSPQKERMDTAYSRWEEPNFAHRTARKASPVPQEEMSLTDCVDFPRRSGEGTGVRLSRTPKTMPPRRERAETAYSGWEETDFTRRSARKPSLDPQEEMSLTDYADLPSITQHERRSDRESSFARDRTRPESPFYSPRENENFRKNRPSRHSMETPCIHVDPSRVVRSYPESRHTIEFEPPSRVPGPDSYRDEDLLRHPSTQVQDTYAETSSPRSARRRSRSPQYETPRRVGMERDMGPARETTRASSTGESTTTNNLEALIGVLQAPKVDLPTFKGDPMQYHIFMRAFDDNVGRTISDPSSKLARLMQLCTGEAARVIQGCTLMSPERGYVRARQLLKDRYGDEFMIAELWGQRLLSTSNRMPLREFADELRAGYESLNALDALDELQTHGNLSEIIKKLPGYLQNKWRDVVRRLKVHEHRRPDLHDVVEYIEEAAAVASDPVYGNQKSEKSSASTRIAYATSNSSPCLVCEREGYEVLSCEKFVALRPEDRLQTAVRLRLCFVCLKGGHITRDCTSKMRCRAENCGRMHATMLHAANWSKLREQGRRRRERAVSDYNREAPAEEPSATGSVYHAQGREDAPGDTISTQESKVALPLVPVRVYSPESKRSHSTYALLDTGSNVTLCHERLLRTLGIQGRPETMSLTTLDKKRNRTPTRVISLDVTDPDGEERLHLGQVYARDSLPIDPRNRVTMSKAARWSHLKGLPLHHAPIDEVMLLIGQDYPDVLVPLAHRARRERRTIRGQDAPGMDGERARECQ